MLLFSLAIIRLSMLLSPICPLLEEFSPPSIVDVLFQRYRFLKVLSDIDCWTQSLPLFITREYRGFNKINLVVENSALRRQVFIVFLQEYFFKTKTTFHWIKHIKTVLSEAGGVLKIMRSKKICISYRKTPI